MMPLSVCDPATGLAESAATARFLRRGLGCLRDVRLTLTPLRHDAAGRGSDRALLDPQETQIAPLDLEIFEDSLFLARGVIIGFVLSVPVGVVLGYEISLLF